MNINLIMIKMNRISDAPYGASAILFNIRFFKLKRINKHQIFIDAKIKSLICFIDDNLKVIEKIDLILIWMLINRFHATN